MDNLKESFSNNLKKINIELKNEKYDQFFKYMEMLIEWNEKINLTAIIKKEEIIVKHFIDSLTIFKYIEKNKTLIDVGTGAGFPGIPLKIANEDLEITLMDSLQKRLKFLEEVIKENKVKNVKIIHKRAEDAGRDKKLREKYDYATARAVANMSTLAEYLLPLVKVGGKCIIMKGPNIEEELNKSKKAINILGGKIEKVEEIVLPGTDIIRNIIVLKKVKATPAIFPRKAGTPLKKPL